MEGVCMTCLATNRRLFSIENVSKLALFKLITQGTIKNPVPISYMLCWECTAQLHSIYRFQIKARRSLQTLESYFNRSLVIPTDKVCLSTLQSMKVYALDWAAEPNIKSEVEVTQYVRLDHNYIEHDELTIDNIKRDDEFSDQKDRTGRTAGGITDDCNETLFPSTSYKPHTYVTRSTNKRLRTLRNNTKTVTFKTESTGSEKRRRVGKHLSGEAKRSEKTHKPGKKVGTREDKESRNETKILSSKNEYMKSEKRKRLNKQSIVDETGGRSEPPPDVTPRDDCFDSDSTLTADEDCVMSESDLPPTVKKKVSFIEVEMGPKMPSKLAIEPLHPIVSRGETLVEEMTWREIRISEQQRLELAAAAKSEVQYVTAPLQCDGCILGFWTDVHFAIHNNKYHKQELPYVCDICKCRFQDKTSMVEHRTRHGVLYDCMKCAFSARSYDDILRHHTRRHTTILHDCRDCDMKFPTLSKLYRHRRCHKPEHKCGRCGKVFSQYALMAKHHRDAHKPKPKKQHQCPICKKVCKAIKLHVKLVHGEQDEIYCGLCKKFYKAIYYDKHLKTKQIHMKPEGFKYNCEKCGKKFTRNIDLIRHVNGIHLNDKPYKCDLCPKRYVHIVTLKRHKEVAHTEGYKQTKDYICEACGKAFHTRNILLEHKVTHTGERPHKCGLCTATFGFKGALYTHNKLVHEKVKRVWPKKKKKSDRSNVKLTEDVD